MKIKNNKNNKKVIIIILLVALILSLGLAYIYIYKNDLPGSQTAAPTSEQLDNPEALPTVEKDESSAEESPSAMPENSAAPTPTKTEGKTPTQYEGEKIDDAPAYNNEQFRIPEESM